MRFGNPEYFILLLLVPIFALFFLWTQRRKRAALNRFVSSKLAERLAGSLRKSSVLLRRICFCLFVLFAVLALVRPRFGYKMEMVERRGVDIIFAVDISKSMLAEDLRPNRLERAKHEIRKFVNLLRGDRVGLIIFAGESFVQCPLTLDYGALLSFLNPVSTDWINLQGTALADAINQATKTFDSESKKHKVLVIISDGEDHEGDVEEAVKSASLEGVIIYTLGIGSERGVPIPVSKSGTSVRYKTDRDGNIVMTRLNPMILERIAMQSSGKYFHAATDFDLSVIYREIDELEKRDFGMNKANLFEERYQIPLLFAFLFLLLEFFISDRARAKKTWKGRFEQ